MRAMLRELSQGDDPKQTLLDAIGDISGCQILHNLVLACTYIEPEKTKGGIIRPDRTQGENRFQGKAFLVLQMGPLAFVDDSIAKFGGIKIEPGDWVFARPSDGWEMFFVHKDGNKGIPCRVFEDTHIKARIADPAMIY